MVPCIELLRVRNVRFARGLYIIIEKGTVMKRFMNYLKWGFLFFVIILLYTSNIFAQNNTNKSVTEETQIVSTNKASYPSGKILISLAGGPGITFPTGEIVGNGDQKRIIDLGYSIGLTTGYLFTDFGGFILGAEYAHEKYCIWRTFFLYPTSTKYDLSFVNISGGFRFLFKYAYVDVGLFWGIKTATWKACDNILGMRLSHDIGGRHVGGFLGGIGISYPAIKYLRLEMGIRFLIAFTPAATRMDRIIPNMGSLIVGITNCVGLSPSP